MSLDDFKPALFIATLGVGSGLLSRLFPGPSVALGPIELPLILVGVWFAIVIAAGVWRSINQSMAAVAIAAIVTWIAWEAAAKVGYWLETPIPLWRDYLDGLLAGGLGASITWAGVAFAANRWRLSHLLQAAIVGSVLGLLLPVAVEVDFWLLFIPWQSVVGGLLGLQFGLMRQVTERSIEEAAVP